MNWEQVEGRWDQLKGKMRQKWGKLTDDDLQVAAGKWDRLYGIMKERYGYKKELVDRELDAMLKDLKPSKTTKH